MRHPKSVLIFVSGILTGMMVAAVVNEGVSNKVSRANIVLHGAVVTVTCTQPESDQ